MRIVTPKLTFFLSRVVFALSPPHQLYNKLLHGLSIKMEVVTDINNASILNLLSASGTYTSLSPCW